MRTILRKFNPQKPQGRLKFTKLPKKKIPGLILRIKEGNHFTIQHGEEIMTCTLSYGGKTCAIIFDGPRSFVITRQNRVKKNDV